MPARRLRPVTTPFIRLRRLLIQHVFDRIIYRDWDLLAHADMRPRIDAHYAEESERLRIIAATVAAARRHQCTPDQDDRKVPLTAGG